MLNADLKEFEITSGFDELVISVALAVPSGSPCGIVQIVHGMNEHKERYYPFMDYLAEEGFMTVIHDNRGHGKSICSEDDLGFMFRNGSEGFVSDIAQLNSLVHARFPQLPLFMLGHGIGASGALCFIRDNSRAVNGLVLTGIPCYSPFSPVVRGINSESAKKLGSRFRSEKVYDVIDDNFGRFFEQPDNSWRCSDAEVVESFNNDPLCCFKTTMNGYEEALTLVRTAWAGKAGNDADPSLPIRFVSGKDDPCMISEKKLFKLMSRLEKNGFESISHRLFDGMRHEVLNEKNNINVWKDIAKSLFSWIDRFNEAQAEISAKSGEAEPESPAGTDTAAEIQE
ncbi:MAG TPA: alpha/beta fold hydrolase [Ruminococcus sp.]|nr:alpha/beta fold hydrolase [Ruminococcus sp.]